MVAWNQFAFNPDLARDAVQKVLTDVKCPISGHQEWVIALGYVEIKPASTFPNFSTPFMGGKVEIHGDMGHLGRENILPSGASGVPSSGFLAADEATYPTVMATCKRCGYVALFNAVVLGLVEPGAPQIENAVAPAERLHND